MKNHEYEPGDKVIIIIETSMFKGRIFTVRNVVPSFTPSVFRLYMGEDIFMALSNEVLPATEMTTAIYGEPK